MTRQAVFIQGGGDGVHAMWDNKLVNSLSNELGPGYTIRYPVMPNKADPSYAAWKPALEKEFGVLKRDAILIRHSLGGTILIKVLAERAPKLALGGNLHHRRRRSLAREDGPAKTSCLDRTSRPDSHLEFRSFFIMAVRMRSRPLRTLSCTPKLFRARVYAA